eukprot:Skav202253  [mRNA]  locus=scaffold1417:305044:308776:+ [translate_table: standard]
MSKGNSLRHSQGDLTGDFSMWSDDEELVDPAGNLKSQARHAGRRCTTWVVRAGAVVGVDGSFWRVTILMVLGSAATIWKFVGKGVDAALKAIKIEQTPGLLSEDRRTIYFMGIIDILTPYDEMKKLEHSFKALRHDWRGVSCCPPPFYASRFCNFLDKAFA